VCLGCASAGSTQPKTVNDWLFPVSGGVTEPTGSTIVSPKPASARETRDCTTGAATSPPPRKFADSKELSRNNLPEGRWSGRPSTGALPACFLSLGHADAPDTLRRFAFGSTTPSRNTSLRARSGWVRVRCV